MKLLSPLIYCSLLFVIPSLKAHGACQFSLKKETPKVTWVAFKTPKKVGVKAAFEKIEITTKSKLTKSINDLVIGSNFIIDASSVNSGNPERDKKLKNIFFAINDMPIKIEGKVLSLKDNMLELELKLHEKTKIIMMRTKIEDKTFYAEASIDVLEFALNDNLNLLNNACKDLHEGKTWSDVEIRIEAQFDQKC